MKINQKSNAKEVDKDLYMYTQNEMFSTIGIDEIVPFQII